MDVFAPHAADFYKIGHLKQYRPGTEYIYQNFTGRGARLATVLPDFDNKAVFFGLQAVQRDLLINLWTRSFFSQPKAQVLSRFQRRMDFALGPGAANTLHMGALHDVGYLPLRIKSLPEGSRVNLRVPYFTVTNTDPRFYWLPGYIESQLSTESWKMINNATIAFEFRRLLQRYCELTGGIKEFVRWQGHDFSMRGMSGLHDGAACGAAHLTCFTGTDSILALDFLEDFYLADASVESVGGSVPATEHSVVTLEGPGGELEFVKRLITTIYPKGVVSSVSDSYDYWWMMTTGIRELKPYIMARQPDMFGLFKTVFRPDSGDPEKIVLGDPDSPDEAVRKGSLRCLEEVFGSSSTTTGHRLLDPHVGLIYGDAITLPRAQAILAGMDAQGFCSSNVVFGIGSYTYQHSTRDTFGHAYKATWGQVDGEAREIFKDPKTDSGLKRSAKGLLRIEHDGGDFVLHDQQTRAQEESGELRVTFENGSLRNQESIGAIRERLLSPFGGM
jgi:nicotinamide phosphoribosyltransferase